LTDPRSSPLDSIIRMKGLALTFDEEGNHHWGNEYLHEVSWIQGASWRHGHPTRNERVFLMLQTSDVRERNVSFYIVLKRVDVTDIPLQGADVFFYIPLQGADVFFYIVLKRVDVTDIRI
jgi:hypothetical protein